MTTYIIVTRNPRTGKLLAVTDGDDDGVLAEFPTEDAAYASAKNTTACRAWGAEILPVGGLGPASA